MTALKSLNKYTFLVASLSILFVMLAHFDNIGHLGLYDDDFARIPSAWRLSLDQLVTLWKHYLLLERGQGRPLHDLLITTIPWISASTSEPLLFCYAVGAIIACINSILFLTFLFRLGFTHPGALVGTVLFVLNPADATHVFLTHALGVQPAQAFILLAHHCYLSKRLVAAWLFALLCLFTYEPYFMMFLVAPLLGHTGRLQRWVRSLLLHSTIGLSLLLVVFALRRLVSEGRVAELHLSSALTHIIVICFKGPLVALYGYLYKPARALYLISAYREPDLMIWLTLSTGAVVLFAWTTSALPASSGDRYTSRALLPMAVTATCMIILSYALSLTVDADLSTVFARPSRIHGVSAAGFGLLTSCLFAATVESFLNRPRIKLIVSMILGFWVLGAILAGILVQRDYATAWQIQRQFWTDLLVSRVPIDSSTDLAISVDSILTTAEAPTLPWAASLILNDLILTNSSDDNPRLYRDETLERHSHLESVLAQYLGPKGKTRHVIFIRCGQAGIVFTGEQSSQIARDSASVLGRYMIKAPAEVRIRYCTN